MPSPWLTPDHEQCWHEAISSNAMDRFRALNFWARRLDELPGPILFTIPKTEHLHGKHQRLMRVSLPCCACGERRWLLPKHLAPFHAPENPVPVTVSAGQQLALGAWGADTQQTQIQVSVQDGFIVTHMLPYSTASPAVLAARGMGAFKNAEVKTSQDGRTQISGTPAGSGPIARDSLEELAKDLAEKQQPINRIVGIRIEGTDDTFLYVMYQMIEADLRANTMKVIVSATVQVMDYSRPFNLHIC